MLKIMCSISYLLMLFTSILMRFETLFLKCEFQHQQLNIKLLPTVMNEHKFCGTD